MRRIFALVAGLSLLASACSSDGTEEANASAVKPSDIAPAEGVVARTMAGELDIEIGGAIEASWSGATPVQILTSVGAGAPEGAWLLQVGLLEQVPATNGWQLRPAFDLVGYKGDGTYTINNPGGAAASADPGTVLQSDAFVVIGGNDREPTPHTELTEPCTLETADTGTRGSVTCPKVTGALGEISVRWSWVATEVLEETSSGVSQPTDDSDDDDAASQGPADPAPTQTSDVEEGTQGELPMDVTLAPKCMSPGVPVTITIATEPKAVVSMALAFSDAKPYGLYRIATADDTGAISWTFTAPADAPEGQGHFIAAGSSEDGERSSKHVTTFEVRLVGC